MISHDISNNYNVLHKNLAFQNNKNCVFFMYFSQSNSLCQHVTDTTHNQKPSFFIIEVKDKKHILNVKILKQCNYTDEVPQTFISPYLPNNGKLWKNLLLILFFLSISSIMIRWYNDQTKCVYFIKCRIWLLKWNCMHSTLVYTSYVGYIEVEIKLF